MDGLGRRVLTDMAVHEPHPWIVGLECNGQVPSPWEKRYVPSGGVVKFERVDARGDVIRGRALGQNHKLVRVSVGVRVRIERVIDLRRARGDAWDEH